MSPEQTNIFLRDLYYAGDPSVDRCYLCGCLNYVSEMKLILGKQVCDCNCEDEDTEELVQFAIEREERVLRNIKRDINTVFDTAH